MVRPYLLHCSSKWASEDLPDVPDGAIEDGIELDLDSDANDDHAKRPGSHPKRGSSGLSWKPASRVPGIPDVTSYVPNPHPADARVVARFYAGVKLPRPVFEKPGSLTVLVA